MNTKQIAVLQQLTNRITRAACYFSTPDQYMNGPVDFKVEAVAGGKVMLSATNAGLAQWFETSIHVIAFIGPKGGIKVYHAEGLSAKQFI